ncbi:MAG TPA: hypothetical protein PKM73_06205 [Verrucomicrobiota bacterium]|nr:hypothetical protein [Verrucomicrobiota bacterium]HNU51016.1 hypothetical protein [Verrucomicrobiota bacterium]
MNTLILALFPATCLVMTAATPAAPATPVAAPVTLAAGADWIPLVPTLDIEPGSALDFSGMGFVDPPAGRHGRVIVNNEGHFAFATAPGKALRFYGVNLCFGAHYLDRAEADRLADRLVRLGYNALRIHHYEQELTQGERPTTRLNPAKLEAFDYLMAALIRRGIYLTTDLFVSRSVPWRDIGVDRDGRIPMDTFKILVPVHAGAYENWREFTRALLTHVNPHTGRSYASEPALAWLSMINEGNFGNFLKDLRTFPEWRQAWNRWLTAHYPDRVALATAWGTELGADEDPAGGTVALPENIYDSQLRTRDCLRFFAETERDMIRRMKTFLRDELGCHALISNANSWTRFTTDQGARTTYDYVDDHFYVDHPQFLEGSWRLPSRCPNTSPVADGAPGGRSLAFTRLFDRPFTITEYNYSAPGRFRGVGGILTGALGALQDWDGIWRFAYSHSRDAMFTPSRLNYFDMACDPLGQAAERASLCLFLRGDLKPAPHRVAVVMTDADLAQPPKKIPTLAPRWHWLAWVTRIGTHVVSAPGTPLPHNLVLPLGWKTPAAEYAPGKVLEADPYAIDDKTLAAAARERGVIGSANPTDPARKVYQSETGEIRIDAPRDQLVLDTPRTAGGYAPAGSTIETHQGGVTIRTAVADATVWVSALDTEPIHRSQRLLVTHLTDLQNTGIRYAEASRQTLLDWGSMPHLVRAGRATVSIALDTPSRYRVWALGPGGRRLAIVPSAAQGNRLEFTADVGADPAAGARMLYEVAVDPSAAAADPDPIDAATIENWSRKFLGWHYWPSHVIPADPKIPGYEAFKNTDVPCVYQLPGQPDRWYMSFIGFNGQGYNSFVAESTNLVDWTNPRLAMGFGPPNEFDFGGCVVGAYLYDSYDVDAPRVLRKHQGRYWTLYGCYPRQGGYELRPGYEGVASSDDGLAWRRAKNTPILAVQDPDCGAWEKDCIYQPWLVAEAGRFYNFYNAANGGREQMGVAVSEDLLTWKRHPGNPIVRNRDGGFDAEFCSDGKVFRDGDHWVMLYFGVGRGGAHIMAAFSRDLLRWTARAEPLYRAGGHPEGLDRQYAHKISLIYNPKNDTRYLYYCACGTQGRGIGLLTSRPLR